MWRLLLNHNAYKKKFGKFDNIKMYTNLKTSKDSSKDALVPNVEIWAPQARQKRLDCCHPGNVKMIPLNWILNKSQLLLDNHYQEENWLSTHNHKMKYSFLKLHIITFRFFACNKKGSCQSNVCVSQGRGCPFYIMLPLEENVHIMCVLFKRRLSI